MRLASVLVVFVLAFVPAVHAAPARADAGTMQSAPEALRALEQARANLANAVKRIEKDPPSSADLDAAHAAVEALKEAIDGAAEHEAKGLEYAKAVLDARKELRTRREYVDDRRAKIQLHEFRRTLDSALAAMTERVSRLQAKEPGAKDFDEARSAVAAVKRIADEARPLAKLDAKFATYLAEVDAKLARQQTAIDDRWLQLSADKQRALLEENRRALSTAMAAFGKTWTDAQFQGADQASAALAKRLEEGAPLEAKDKAYRAEAEKARGELANAKKRMAELVKEAGLSRVKADIEPAYEELSSAAKALRARQPAPEQLAQAKTAALVVRMLVDKYEPQAARSPELGQYLSDVKKTLLEVEVALQRRTLEAARRDVMQALRQLDKRAPADEQFEEASSAVLVLEKTLETVHKKDPELNALAADARQLIRDGRASIAKRRQEVELQRHRAKIDEARKAATAAVAQLQKDRPTEAQLKEAEDAVKQIGVVLEEGVAFLKKDRDYIQYARETKERSAELSDRIVRRRVVLAAQDGRKALQEAVAAAKERLEAAKRPEATDADVESVSKAVEAISQSLESGAELESKDAGYAAQAERTRNELGRLYEGFDAAARARELRKETAEALAAGVAASRAAAAAKDLRKQKSGYETAVAHFRSCQENGARLMKATPGLERTVVLLEGQPSTPRDVIALCATQAESSETALNQASALLRVEEGPIKAFEAAKYLLGKSKKKEALATLADCIAEGRIVENRWPEMKDRKFEVAGGSMTLSQMIQECAKERKAIEGK